MQEKKIKGVKRHFLVDVMGLLLCIVVHVLIARCFCGYVCPLGTTLDFFDALLGRVRRVIIALRSIPAFVNFSHFRYIFLAAIAVPALFGISLAGYIAPIPVFTRFCVIVLSPFQTAFYRGWYQVPNINSGEVLSVILFIGIVALGLIQRRFWCRYLCPTGALLSLVASWKLFGKKVDPKKCTRCSHCAEACSFGAIDKTDVLTVTSSCTTCLTCKTVCNSKAISCSLLPQGTQRMHKEHKEKNSRRKFLLETPSLLLIGMFAGLTFFTRPRSRVGTNTVPIRPPGSIPEMEFLKRCVRCGKCLRACPNNALQPISLNGNGEQLWTPQLMPDWSGCEPSCNNCGFVCPTHAIRALPLLEKRACRIGLAVIDQKTCLPFIGKEECQLCYDECHQAGYDAIEFMRVGTKIDEFGMPIEDTGFLAPVLLPEKCVGCGLCQTRCRAINAVQKCLIKQSAIQVVAGEGREDRVFDGSYRALRQIERKQKSNTSIIQDNSSDDYLPDFLQ